MMIKAIMHGCNGKMGQVIAGLAAEDAEITLVAGIDAHDEGKNPFPVFTSIKDCDVSADVVIDFSVAPAVDGLLEYCMEKQYIVSISHTKIGELLTAMNCVPA